MRRLVQTLAIAALAAALAGCRGPSGRAYPYQGPMIEDETGRVVAPPAW